MKGGCIEGKVVWSEFYERKKDSNLHDSPTAAFGDDHVLVVKPIGQNSFVVDVKDRNRFQSRGHATSSNGLRRRHVMHQSLNDGMLRRR